MMLLVVISFAVSVTIYYALPDVYSVISRMLSRFTVFIIGTYVGKLVKEGKSFHEGFLIASVVILAGTYPLYECDILPGVWSRYYGSLTGMALVFLLSQFFILASEWKIDRFFAFFGPFSLEIYVLSIIARRIYYFTPWYTDGYAFLHYMIVMVFTIFIAWAVSKIEQPIFKLLLKPRKEKST